MAVNPTRKPPSHKDHLSPRCKYNEYNIKVQRTGGRDTSGNIEKHKVPDFRGPTRAHLGAFGSAWKRLGPQTWNPRARAALSWDLASA